MAEARSRARTRHRVAGGSPALGPTPDQPQPLVDNLIHERTRLGIVSALAARDQISFAELKSILGATDGNISAHTRKLEDAGYITATKRFEGRLPRTEYALTPAGRRALERYIQHMENLIHTVRRT